MASQTVTTGTLSALTFQPMTVQRSRKSPSASAPFGFISAQTALFASARRRVAAHSVECAAMCCLTLTGDATMTAEIDWADKIGKPSYAAIVAMVAALQ